MDVFAYGEDALTLWALKEKLSEILKSLNDTSDPFCCQIFYRPSFGRGRYGFGEFDFILLAKQTLYLGESKWNKSNEKKKIRSLHLRDEQRRRHEIFTFYLETWAFGDYVNWDKFKKEKEKDELLFLRHSVPESKSLLANNIIFISDIIKRHYQMKPDVTNVLLYLHKNNELPEPPHNFFLVPIDYSEASVGNFIRLNDSVSLK